MTTRKLTLGRPSFSGAAGLVICGAGIAGATVASHLARDRRVVLIEAEEAAGYHTTGRSAAMWILNYGPPDVRVLTGLSRGFFEHPPPGFADSPLLHQRSSLVLASEDQREAMAAFKASAKDIRAIRPEEARALVPALRPGYAVEATLDGLHQSEVPGRVTSDRERPAMVPASACNHASSARSNRLSDRPVMSGERISSCGRAKTRVQIACVAIAAPIASGLLIGRTAKSSDPKL